MSQKIKMFKNFLADEVELMLINSFNYNTDYLKKYLKKGGDPNYKFKKLSNFNLLKISLELNDEKKFKLLIKYGADINIKDNYGNTIIISSVMKNNYNFINLCLKKDANLYIKNDYGNNFFDVMNKNDYLKTYIKKYYKKIYKKYQIYKDLKNYNI